MNKIIEKMENHIRKLKQRNLSLHGKAITKYSNNSQNDICKYYLSNTTKKC